VLSQDPRSYMNSEIRGRQQAAPHSGTGCGMGEPMKHKCDEIRNEQGVAIIATLMLVMALAVLTSALIFTVQNEIRASTSYKFSRQALGVANAGVQKSIQWFVNSYSPWATSASYTLTTSPVQYGGSNVLLAGQTGSAAVYPDTAVSSSFAGRSAAYRWQQTQTTQELMRSMRHC